VCLFVSTFVCSMHACIYIYLFIYFFKEVGDNIIERGDMVGDNNIIEREEVAMAAVGIDNGDTVQVLI